MDVELFKKLTKYPFIHNGFFHDSLELKQNKTCREKCKAKDCLTIDSSKNEFICSKGYNNIFIHIKDETLLINGLIFHDNKVLPAGTKDIRKDYQVSKDNLLLFMTKIAEIEKYITEKINDNTEKNFSMFHDFKTSMSIFYTCTQAIVAELPGEKFEDKLENGNQQIKSLYNALELITSQLGMIDIIINPKSITFGTKKLISIYKLFHKISILFQHLSEKKHVKIELINVNGAYIDSSLCYETIEFIPLILLDNAIKYSVEYSTIKIEITQMYYSARVKVKNIGPFVKEENHDRIFEKFFRDEAAKSFSKQGIGIGLWTAQKILEAHGTKLSYFKDRSASGDIGLNIFEFELPTTERSDFRR